MSERSTEFILQIHRAAAMRKSRIAFPDACDARTLIAALDICARKIAQPILIGKASEINQLAEKEKINIQELTIIEPEHHEKFEKYSISFVEKRRSKGISIESARKLMTDPLYFAGMMLSCGDADCCVAGSYSTTGNVLRAGIQTVGLHPQSSVVSSYFLMLLADGRAMAFADCGVVPDPTTNQLTGIAFATAANFHKVTDENPRVAFLSFSTKGSAEHSSVVKVREAAQLFKEQYPSIISDGELQADAALIEHVAERKAPDSPIKGNANVLIFPDLNSGNIAYKLVERLAGAQAFGPIIQGLEKPYCDLSRGCSSADIVNTAAITAQMW